jgi:hypothetical protein
MTHETSTETRRFVVLSYGMGVDSTAILLRWLSDPSSRDFDLADLIVVTSQTGSEFRGSISLCEQHVLPLLKAAGVRFVEIARHQRSQKGQKFTVLQDSRSPERLHPAGAYTLAREMIEAGTVPQSGGGHLCSIKSKAVPIEAWLAEQPELLGERVHVMGYAKGEESRSAKDVAARAAAGTLVIEPYRIAFGFAADEMPRSEKTERVRAEKAQVVAEFPLQTWGWDRDACLAFIAEQTGAVWPKSACTFCPFAFSRKDRHLVLGRFDAEPAEALEGLLMEAGALALNPRAKLFKTTGLREALEAAGHTEALALFEDALDAAPWAIYRTRRQFTERRDHVAGCKKSTCSCPISTEKFGVNRSVEIVAQGSRAAILEHLELLAEDQGLKVDRDGPIARATVQGFTEKSLEAREEILAAAPQQAEAKAPRFDEAAWAAID